MNNIFGLGAFPHCCVSFVTNGRVTGHSEVRLRLRKVPILGPQPTFEWTRFRRAVRVKGFSRSVSPGFSIFRFAINSPV